MKVSILTVMGPGSPRTVRLSRQSTSLGRSTQSDVLLDHPSVSRHHADLELREEGCVLMDRDSRNGTRVNGVAVMRRLLHDGERVAFGDVETVFQEVDEEVTSSRSEFDACQESRVTDDAEGEASMTSATMTLSLEALPHDEKWDLLQAWQIVRRFGEPKDGEVGTVLKGVAQELAGMRDVRKSLVYVAPAVLGVSAKWFGAEREGGTSRRLMMEETILDVAAGGRIASLSSGRCLRDAIAPVVEAVCLPVCVSGKPCACLYLEGDDRLPVSVINAVRAAAQAIGVGLTIWLQASRDRTRQTGPSSNPVIVGKSRAIQRAVNMAGKAALSDSTVLIRGETGTGKELFARLIYLESARRKALFLPVHCSAIEETLMGSVLFGHEKGAFTGAVGLKKGVFEEADGGTIFLDEIGELTPSVQVKLLRVLQEGEFMRIGGNKPIRVDVRVIAATNRDLEKAMQQGLFREDLYYRLNVVTLRLPSLRERREDITEMVRHFLSDIAGNVATSAREVTPEAMALLERYDWPGNVRELRNVIERCLVLAEGPTLTVDDLPPELACMAGGRTLAEVLATGRGVNLGDVERRHIQDVLQECHGNKRLAAQRLGISRSTLYEKLGRAAVTR